MRLAAQDTYGVVVVLQAMDAAGKDGTIRHVMSGVNPQGVQVSSFKIPSSDGPRPRLPVALRSRSCPSAATSASSTAPTTRRSSSSGSIPQILAGQKIPPKLKDRGIWNRRFREINDWEHYLTDQGFRFVKLFLNLSNEEQRSRFLSRIDEPEKNWKFSANDAKERAYWDDYQKAFSEVLSNTSTDVGALVRHPGRRQAVRAGRRGRRPRPHPDRARPAVPQRVSKEARDALQATKVELEAQAPAGAAPDPYAVEVATKAAKKAGDKKAGKKGKKS